MFPFVFAPNGLLFGINPWGFFACVGLWVWLHFAERMVKEQGYDLTEFRAAVTWVVITGTVLGHVLDEVFYHPDILIEHPVTLLYLQKGQSSCGGFVGAFVGGWMWKHFEVKRGRIARRPQPLALLPVAEIMMATFPVGYIFARLGCALVHDHPGRLASPGSWLAVAWPTGPEDGVVHAFGPLLFVFGSTSRYDLGLLECLFLILLAPALVLSWRRRRPLGYYTALVCLTYAPVRLALDFLRVDDGPDADRRYAWLTFAQWFCVAMFAAGVMFFARLRSRAATAAAEPLAP